MSAAAMSAIRQPRGVELTAFGERALDHARTALSHLEAIEREAMAQIGEETGAIRLAGFPGVFATVLPPLLRRFEARFTAASRVRTRCFASAAALPGRKSVCRGCSSLDCADLAIARHELPSPYGAISAADAQRSIVPARLIFFCSNITP